LAIARNLCRKVWRLLSDEVCLDENVADRDIPLLDRLAIAEYQALLNVALSKLPPLQREALFLFERMRPTNPEDYLVRVAAHRPGVS
jgi:DNA-directed RNA polymerase specialized sigma24 family protein